MSWSELERVVDDVEGDSALQRALKHCRSRKELIRAALRLGYRITQIDLLRAWQEEQRDQELGFSWDATGCRTDCSWFGFKIAVKPRAAFSRTELAQEHDRNLIGNRMLFGGDLLRQPAFVQLREDRPKALRVVGEMKGSDEIMASTLFLGTYPGLTQAMLDQEIKVIDGFMRR